MKQQLLSVLLVGCGRMGGALVQGWSNISPPPNINIIVRNKNNVTKVDNNDNITAYQSIEELSDDYNPDVIIFAVKPQMLGDVMPAYAAKFGNNPFYLSVAAGKKIEFYQSIIGTESRIVRTMPNTPALIGKGITAIFSSDNASNQDKAIAEQLMQAIGKVAWLDSESQMDAVTAISGSGPAYVFYFIECMIAAGVKAGLSHELAESLTKQTLLGSSELAAISDDNITILRQNVTSPNGTTQAALDKWMQPNNGLMELANQAIQAAIKRSQELAL